jgi:hypothetical protein
MRRLILCTALALLAGAPAVSACQSDADCADGAQCMKPYGVEQGVCKGGARGPQGGYGAPSGGQRSGPQGGATTCSSDDDCPSDRECLIRGDGDGVCVPRR